MSCRNADMRLHECLGVTMLVLVCCHIFLNRFWYSALFKGSYGTHRKILTFIDLSLMICFFMTAFCGMSMSTFLFPFMNGFLPLSAAERLCSGFSCWLVVFAGLHLGMHITAILSRFKLRYATKRDLKAFFTAAAAYGFTAFIRNRFYECLFFRSSFTYDGKSIWVLLEEWILIFLFFAFLAEEISSLTILLPNKKDRKKDIAYTALCIALAIIVGISIAQAMN